MKGHGKLTAPALWRNFGYGRSSKICSAGNIFRQM